MREFLPIIIVAAIICSFALVFIIAYIALQKTVHRPVGRKIRQHFADGSLLSAGQSEGEQTVKAIHRNGLHRNGGFFSGGPAGLPQRQIKIE